MSAVVRDPLTSIAIKLAACIRLLASDKEFERKGAMSGMERLLKGADTNMTNALADRIRRAGGVLTEGPTDDPKWKMQSMALDDLDGYHITIFRKTS